MSQISTNITPKYRQETHYNYVQNSEFVASSFTGKERDSETGFSYFGARYYDSDLMTGWLSVDPMADKYPNLSPYAYCANNPIKLVDPDGKEIWIVTGTDNNGDWITKKVSSINDHPSNEQMNVLRKIYENNKGKEVIDEIMKSDKIFTIGEKIDYVTEHSVSEDLYVSWGIAAENHGGNERNVLAEEIFHCYQIVKGAWKFTGMSKNEKLDCEITAKEFAAKTLGYDNKYFYTQGFYIPTEMHIMDKWDYGTKKSYLQKGVKTKLPRYKNDPTFDNQSIQSGIYYHEGAY